VTEPADVDEAYATLTDQVPDVKVSLCRGMDPQSVLEADARAVNVPETSVPPFVAVTVQVPSSSRVPGTVAPIVRVRVSADHWSNVISGVTAAASGAGSGAAVVVWPGPTGVAVGRGVDPAVGEAEGVSGADAEGVGEVEARVDDVVADGSPPGPGPPVEATTAVTTPATTRTPATTLSVTTVAFFMAHSSGSDPAPTLMG
jgi:hypothetical protein